MHNNDQSAATAEMVVLRLVQPESICGFAFAACDIDLTLAVFFDDKIGYASIGPSSEELVWLRNDYAPLDHSLPVNLADLHDRLRRALWKDCGGFHVDCNESGEIAEVNIVCGSGDRYSETYFRPNGEAWTRTTRAGDIICDASLVEAAAIKSAAGLFRDIRAAARAGESR